METRHVTSGRTRQVTPDRFKAPARPLERAVANWLADGRSQGHSPRTVELRRYQFDQFCWWLEHEASVPLALENFTAARFRAFLAYSREARAEGRWGSQNASAKREARPWTANGHYRTLRALCNFLVGEGLLETSPLRNVKPPRVPQDEIVPFSEEQIQSLLDGARRGSCSWLECHCRSLIQRAW